MQLCRGPLPAGHPRAGVAYFCPDADVPLQAANLATTPSLHKFQYTEQEAVLLDAHRAPDEWFAAACRMPNLLIQGDPDAMRPVSCAAFAAELSKMAAVPRTLRPELRCCETLTKALPLAKGRCVVLCSTYEMRDNIYAHLRPNGLQPGDGAVDRYGRYTTIERLSTGPYVSVDGGRRMVRKEFLTQHLIVSPSSVRSGEYDTIIVMPDVPHKIGQAACARVRYMIVGVGHSPMGYIY